MEIVIVEVGVEMMEEFLMARSYKERAVEEISRGFIEIPPVVACITNGPFLCDNWA